MFPARRTTFHARSGGRIILQRGARRAEIPSGQFQPCPSNLDFGFMGRLQWELTDFQLIFAKGLQALK